MEQDKIYFLKASQMTVTVWLKQEVVLNWAQYENDLHKIFYMTTREPGDLDMVQVNITLEQYKQIKSHLL
mgnify:CR=1 FL=1|tara:strand:- start:251 stop:460 length:210 start_codon:yes stop_codon:yes gene_type:complete